jgi:hypothetical protein
VNKLSVYFCKLPLRMTLVSSDLSFIEVMPGIQLGIISHLPNLANAALRLWYCHSEGIYGFLKDDSKAAKWLKRTKKMSPHLDIHTMKQKIIDVIGVHKTPSMKEFSAQVKDDDGVPGKDSWLDSTVEISKKVHPAPGTLNFTQKESIAMAHDTDIEKKTGLLSLTSHSRTAYDAASFVASASPHAASVAASAATADDFPSATLATIMATPVHTPTSITTVNVATTFTNIDAVSGQDNLKTCKECSQPKPQTGFTASQWKKRVGTGSCIACVSKCIQWKVYNVGSAFQTKVCSECKGKKSHLAFSPNQWRKTKGVGRCKECVVKSLPHGD